MSISWSPAARFRGARHRHRAPLCRPVLSSLFAAALVATVVGPVAAAQAPVAIDSSDTVAVGQESRFRFRASDADRDRLTFSWSTPTRGTISDPSTVGCNALRPYECWQSVKYVPEPDFVGTVTVTFTATDPSGLEDTGTAKLRYVEDTRPPTGSLTVKSAQDSLWTRSTNVKVTIDATDDLSQVDLVRLSNVATASGGLLTTFEERSYTHLPMNWSLLDAGGDGSEGWHRVYAQWRDSAGNWSTVRYRAVLLDQTGPEVSALKLSIHSKRIGSGVPVRITGTVTDPGGSGVQTSEVQRSVDGGEWKPQPQALHDDGYFLGDLAPNRSYRYRVRGIDHAGNRGPWRTTVTFTPRRYEDGSSNVRYSSGWAEIRYAGISVVAHNSRTAGATARLSFRGRYVAMMVTKDTDHGKASMYVGPSLVRTLDTYAESQQFRQIVFGYPFATSAARTLTVRVAGTSGRPLVEVDTFFVIE